MTDQELFETVKATMIAKYHLREEVPYAGCAYFELFDGNTKVCAMNPDGHNTCYNIAQLTSQLVDALMY